MEPGGNRFPPPALSSISTTMDYLDWVKPAYASWDDMPFRVYMQAQKIVRDKYNPKAEHNVLAELDLLILLYGLTEAQLDLIPADHVPAMWQGVKGFALNPPPIIEDLAEFVSFGKTYKIDREPRDITVLQLKAIEEYRALYADEIDLMLVHCALLVAPETAGAYGQPGPPQPFDIKRGHQWEFIQEWPTPVCYSLHAFFLRHWLRSKVLTPLSTALEQKAIAETEAGTSA